MCANREEWDEVCKRVVLLMLDHIGQYVSPISKVISEDYGEHLGSGSYLYIGGQTFLITNEHVGRAMSKNPLAHKFMGDEAIWRCAPMVCLEYPIDVAITKIEGAIWNKCKHQSNRITEMQFAPNHNPQPGELLFLIGYSGARTSFRFGNLVTHGTPYSTQEAPLPIDWGDPKYHFALHYKPDLVVATSERAFGLPSPPGMSGSLVWNTRFVEFTSSGRRWSPEESLVTGIVWGWQSSSGCLLATKVEHFSLHELVGKYPAS